MEENSKSTTSMSERWASLFEKQISLEIPIPGLKSLSMQLIIPYVLLTLVLALIGMFVITRLVTSSVRERFLNQLFDASRSVADSFVRLEDEQLANLRLMAYTQGVAEAVERGDSDELQTTLWPLMLNNEVDALAVVDRTGEGVITITNSHVDGEYVVSYGDPYGDIPLVAQVLAGEVDDAGDKYIGLVTTNEGDYLFTVGPIPDDEGNLIGAILVGAPLDEILASMKSQVLADILLFDPDGALRGSTLIIPGDYIGTVEDEVGIRLQQDSTDVWQTRLSGRSYEVAFSPWLLRGSRVGSLGVALPSNFIVTTMATSRNSFSFIFALGTLAMIVLGLGLSQNIAKPILRMRNMSQAVASGDLDQKTGVERPDEIGDLASAFDEMTQRLKERTEEAEKLYAQMVERNLELAETNDRLQRTRAQLVQSEKLAAVGQLTAGIVHDVKNPLAVIKGLAEELEEEDLGLDVEDSLSMIRDSASKANTIVTDLLKFARQSTPTKELRDLRETMETSLRLTEYLTRKSGVRVTQEFPETPVLAMVDAQQIEQVLVNLITNAVQAMPEGGDLSAIVSRDHDEVCVEIRDTGVGISEENINRIFDPFFTTKPEGEGTGLGLSVSYGIVAQHGGRIEVESEPGEGSAFTLHIPYDPSLHDDSEDGIGE